MEVDFNSIIRNKIRDFIGCKTWSVSRFAKRYVEAFAELYSKQEAPSTSTARKLVEEEGHVYTEREILVMDSFSNMELYQIWLEGQKKQLIERSNQYYQTNDSDLIIDSPVLFASTLSRLKCNNKQLSLADVESVIQRYEKLDSNKPLLLISESSLLMEAAMQMISPRYDFLRIDAEKNLISGLKSIIATASKGEKIFGLIVSSKYRLADRVTDIFGSEIFILYFGFSGTMVESALRAPDWDDRASRSYLCYRVNKCLQLRMDFPPLFTDMMQACAASPWVIFPDCEGSRQIMVFIEEIYRKISTVFENAVLSAKLENLIKEGMPDKWLTDDCNQIVLLEYLTEYAQWKADKLAFIDTLPDENKAREYREALKWVEDIDIDALKLWGDTTDLLPGNSVGWFDRCFNTNLVEIDFMKLLDVALATEKRSIQK